MAAMRFDPKGTLSYFRNGGLAMLASTEFDTTRPMGNVAMHQLSDVLRVWLIGLEESATPVIPRLLEWLDYGIRTEEDFGTHPVYHQMNLAWARALAGWMLTGNSEKLWWERARGLHLQARLEGGAFDESELCTAALDDYMALCIGAGAYAEGVAEFERCFGCGSVARLEPRHFGYAYCMAARSGAGAGIDGENLKVMGERLLKRNLAAEWLGRGQVIRGITWLKIVCELDAPDLPPVRLVRTAYKNMPGVEAPFLSL